MTIPNSVTEIGARAFDNCTKLTVITNHSTTPQTIDANVFELVDKGSCKLYVPKGSKSAYATAPVWKDFSNIIEINTSSIEFICSVEPSITATNGFISISGIIEGTPIAIYDINGKQIYAGLSNTISVYPGLYIVRIGDKAHKIEVR